VLGADYGQLLDGLRGVRWPARRTAAGTFTGAHGSRLRGASPEVTEWRAYRQGDDPRRLDWRLLARSERAFVRLSVDRSELATVIVVDASASMAYPIPAHDKWRLARQIAVGLAAVARAAGDPVGGAVAADRMMLAPPRARPGAVPELAALLDRAEPAGQGNLAAVLRSPVMHAARLVVVSDLLGEWDAVLPLLREHEATGAEAHVVHVIADDELNPPSVAILATDPEDAAIRRPLSVDTRAAYDSAFAEWRDGIARSLRAAGVNYVTAITTESADRVVRRVSAGSGA